MNILRVILGLFIGWIILVVLSIAGIIGLFISFIRGLFQNVVTPRPDTKYDSALEMVRCPHCGVYYSGICSNPECSKR